MKKVILAARQRKIPIIFLRVAFRTGHPEANLNNKLSAGIAKQGALLESSHGSEVHDQLKPEEGDIIITQKRLSAFTGTELEIILRSKGVNRIVLTGISTSGVVLSTLRHSADNDYDNTVLSDCCGDRDDSLHDLLISKIFPRQALILTGDVWITNLEKNI